MKLLKVLGVLLIMFSLINATACSELNKQTSKKVTDVLEKKYGREFEAVAIGNRINTGSTTLYLRPTEDVNNVFAVIYEDGNVHDEFVRSIVLHKVENRIIEVFDNYNIDIGCLCILSTYKYSGDELNQNISIEEFTEKYDLLKARAYCICDNKEITKENAEQFYNAIKELDKSSEFDYELWFFSMDEDRLDECKEEFVNSVEMTSDIIAKYEPAKKFVFGIEKKFSEITKEDVIELMFGE